MSTYRLPRKFWGFDSLEITILGIVTFVLISLFGLTFGLSFLEQRNKQDNNHTPSACWEKGEPKFTVGSVQIVFRNDLILLSGENSYSCPSSSICVPPLKNSIYRCKIIQFTAKEKNVVLELTDYEKVNLISMLADPTYHKIFFECSQKLAENKSDLVRFSLGFEKSHSRVTVQ